MVEWMRNPSLSVNRRSMISQPSLYSRVIGRWIHTSGGGVCRPPIVDVPPVQSGAAAAAASPSHSSSSSSSSHMPPHTSHGGDSRLSRLLKDITGRGDSSLAARLRPHTFSLVMACLAWTLAVRNMRDKSKWQDQEDALRQQMTLDQDKLHDAALKHAEIHSMLIQPTTWSSQGQRQQLVATSEALLLFLNSNADTAATGSSTPSLVTAVGVRPTETAPHSNKTPEKPTTLF
jgi:hypothetical protein